jgi:hypothetical protein
LLLEDGDRKGFQSTKGLSAKKTARISTLKLPPRSPGLHVLDYAVWQKVDEKMLGCAPNGRESKKDFIARLKHCARRVCTGKFLRKKVSQIKGRLADVVASGGFNPKND